MKRYAIGPFSWDTRVSLAPWRRVVDTVAHRIGDDAAPGTFRYATREYLCWVATEWPGRNA